MSDNKILIVSSEPAFSKQLIFILSPAYTIDVRKINELNDSYDYFLTFIDYRIYKKPSKKLKSYIKHHSSVLFLLRNGRVSDNIKWGAKDSTNNDMISLRDAKGFILGPFGRHHILKSIQLTLKKNLVFREANPWVLIPAESYGASTCSCPQYMGIPLEILDLFAEEEFARKQPIQSITKLNDRMIFGVNDGEIKFWKFVGSNNRLEEMRWVDGGVGITSLTPINDKQVIVATHSIAMRLINITTGSVDYTFSGHHGTVNAIIFVAKKNLLVSGSNDTTIKIWNFESKELIGTFLGHKGAITSLAVTHDDKYIISGSEDKSIKVWELDTGKEIQTFSGHDDQVSFVNITPDNQHILSVSKDKTIRAWNFNSGVNERTLGAHDDAVNMIVFSPKGDQFVTCSDDSTIIMWNSNKYKIVYQIRVQDHVKCCLFYDETILILGDDSGFIYIIDVVTGNLLRKHHIHEYRTRGLADEDTIFGSKKDNPIRSDRKYSKLPLAK